MSLMSSGCVPVLHALRVLWAYGMCDLVPNIVYQAVVIAKLTYTVRAWRGLTKSADRRRTEAFQRRSVRCDFCRSDLPSVEQLVKDSDLSLFSRVMNDKHHVLHRLLPDERPDSYNLLTHLESQPWTDDIFWFDGLRCCLARLLFKDSHTDVYCSLPYAHSVFNSCGLSAIHQISKSK